MVFGTISSVEIYTKHIYIDSLNVLLCTRSSKFRKGGYWTFSFDCLYVAWKLW